MPGSFPVFDAAIERLIAATAPMRALDIGAGAGKLGRMLERQVPTGWRAAVEVEPSYIERFGLHQIYQRVDVANITAWWPQHLDETYDMVLIGDCLEHLPKSAGLDLLNALVYRTAWLVVVVPEFVIQGAVDGVASEQHVSAWSERDLHWHDLYAWDNARAMTLAVLRGYRPAPLALRQVVGALHGAKLMVHDFDGTTPVRPLRMAVAEQVREVSYRPG